MISFNHKGDFKKANSFFEKLKETVKVGDLDRFGRMGVEALKRATPMDTGETANSWYYEIKREDGKTSIEWHNSHVEGYCNIAILLQYGHGTRNGGYVVGRDYINPAIQPIFDDIAEKAWREVKAL